MTQVTYNAPSSGKCRKIHFITKYFDARWGFLVRVLLHGKPYVMKKINKLEEIFVFHMVNYSCVW